MNLSFWEATSLITALKDERETKWRLSEDGFTLILTAEIRVSESSQRPGVSKRDKST